MKPYSEHLALDFSEFIRSLKHIRIAGGIRFENFLFNFQNKIGDTHDYLIDTLPYVISPVTKNKSKQMLVDLGRIYSQSSSALDILYKINYDSKNMDRIINMLEILKDESDKFIKYINNTLEKRQALNDD
ncbi:MAG TPA: hypothetical protein PKW80_00195 [Bacteroidales bacterium]|nr:hypothetical protein [Bacteroidales bacterium]